MSRTPGPLPVLTLLCFAGLVPASAAAQEPEYPTEEDVREAENAPLFSSHEVFSMMVRADFHALMREDRDTEQDSEERPAVMEWTAPDGSTGTREIQIQTRGNFRLSRRNCDFPPLRLNVKKGEVEGTVFEIQDKLKVVSPCKLGQDYWQQYVYAEYLVYRMLNVLTPLAFRARLVQMTYVDESGEMDTFTRHVFLLEDDSELAKRNGAIKQDWQEGQLNPALQDRDYAILIEFFQYMVGNTDWSGVEMHNMELLRDPNGRPFPVPFDFDFSGIVDARYAVPDPLTGLRSVRQRRFWGFCPDQVSRSQEHYDAVIRLFQEKKEELYDVWRTFEWLEEDRLEDTLEYLDDFYEILDRPGRVQRDMLDACRRIGR